MVPYPFQLMNKQKDGIDIMNYQNFLKDLWAGKIL